MVIMIGGPPETPGRLWAHPGGGGGGGGGPPHRLMRMGQFPGGGGGGGAPKPGLKSRRRMTINLSFAGFSVFSFLQKRGLEEGDGVGSICTTRSMDQTCIYSVRFFSFKCL